MYNKETTIENYHRVLVKTDKDTIYNIDSKCPSCGEYTYDGDIYTQCKKKYGLYKEKVDYAYV